MTPKATEPLSNKVIADYANESMNNTKNMTSSGGANANAKTYTIIEESGDEQDPEQEHQLNAL